MSLLVSGLLMGAVPPATDDVLELGPVWRIDGMVLLATPCQSGSAGGCADSGTPHASPGKSTPTMIDLSAGWTALGAYDPFTQSAGTSFTARAPGFDSRVETERWALHAAADIIDRSLRMHNLNFEVRRELFSLGATKVGLYGQYADVALRHQSYTDGQITLATRREAWIAWGGIDVSHRVVGTEVTMVAAAGRYASRYWSELDVPSFTGSEPIGMDLTSIAGAELAIRDFIVAKRLWIRGSVRYLRIIGTHAAWSPDADLSVTAWIDARVGTILTKPVFIGAVVRVGPRGPALLTNRSFGLRATLKLR